MYTLDAEGHMGFVYNSRGRYEDTVYLHLYQGHFSYNKDFNLFAKKFQYCDKLWNHHGHFIRHKQMCRDKTSTFTREGSIYKPSKTIFEELSYFGINARDQVYGWFIVYDFESLLHKVEGQKR